MAALKHPFGSRTRIAGAAVAALSLAWLAASCGGGGGGDSDDTDTAAPTQISADTVKTAAADASSFVSLCNPSSTSAAAPRAGSSALVSRALGLAQMQRERRLMQGRMQAMAAGDPLVENGDCGGKYEMTEDSSGGTTSSGALVFTNYCELNSDTGAQEVVSGSVTLSVTRSTVNGVNVTSRIAAESPDGLRTQVRAAASLSPIASRMRGGVGAPELHAEPCDAWMPARSSAGSRFLPSTCGKRSITVFGRLVASGVMTSWSTRLARTPRTNASRTAAMLAARIATSFAACSIASAFAAANAGLCVPGRRPCSCPPPRASGRSREVRSRTINTP